MLKMSDDASAQHSYPDIQYAHSRLGCSENNR